MPIKPRPDCWKLPKAGRYSWMRSVTCRRPCRSTAAGHSGAGDAAGGRHHPRFGGRPLHRRHPPRPAADVQEGHFRQDLYFRLNVIAIRLPPLTERTETSPCWPTTSFKQLPTPQAKPIPASTVMLWSCSTQYSWPGNVRELENIIERAVTLADKPTIGVVQLPDYIRNLSIETYRSRPPRCRPWKSRKNAISSGYLKSPKAIKPRRPKLWISTGFHCGGS